MKDNLKIIVKYFKRFNLNKKYLLLMAVTSLLASLVNTISPIFNGKLIDSLISSSYDGALLYLLIFIILILLYNIFYAMNYYFYTLFFKHVYNGTQRKLVRKLFQFDKSTLNSNIASKYNNVINTSVDEIADLGDYFVEVVIDIFALILSLYILFTIDIIIVLLILVINCISLYLFDRSNKRAEKIDGKKRREKDKMIDIFSGLLSSIDEIKNLNVESRMERKYTRVSNNYVKKKMSQSINNMIINHIIPGFVVLLQGTFMAYLVILIKDGNLSVEEFVVIISYYASIQAIVTSIMSKMNSIRITNVAMTRVESLLEYNVVNKYEFGKHNNTNIKGNIKFNNVSLNYGSKVVLDEVTFEIPNNKTTAIIGRSSSGKSSLLSLILRRIKPDKGSIYIDDVDVFDYSKEAHDRNVGVVMQDPVMFRMNVKNNLIVSDNSGKYQEVVNKLKIDDFVLKLPQQYNTIISQDSLLLTLEEKQRIALARVLIEDAQIILLDELTNKLDKNVVSELDEITNDLEGNHTIVTITNNKDEMKNSDYIIAIDNGKVVAKGTHDELIENNEFYKELFNA